MLNLKKKKISWLGAASLVILTAISAQAQQMLPTDVEAQQLSDAMAQTSGEFDAMNLGYIHSLGMQQKAWNDPLMHLGEGQTKPGYSRYTWTPEVVLPIRLREGMMTLINLPPWELIEKVHIGSPESFGGEIAAPNSLLVYADPSYIGVDSNMIIFGRSGNRYVFYLRSETYNTDKITHSVVDVLVGPKYTPVADGGQLGNFNGATTMAATSYTQRSAFAPTWSGRGSSLTPGGAQNPQIGLNTASTAPKDWLQNIPVDPEKFRFDMEIFLPNPSDIDIAPDKVWRDDIFTYIDLGPKALTMTQRPVVSLIVQDSEVPVGFRTRGPNSRLIVVEAVGDLVLRNGKKIICLKLRRDPASGLEYTDYSGDQARTWYAPAVPGPDGRPTTAAGMNLSSNSKQAALSMDGKTVLRQSDLDQILAAAGQNNVSINQTSTVNTAYDSVAEQTQSVMQGIPANVRNSAAASSGIVGVMQQVQAGAQNASGVRQSSEETASSSIYSANDMYGVVGQGLMGATESISVELGSHADIATLETMWESIASQNEDVLKGYEPYYSVDTTADGDVKELFRLRIGPMKNVQAGDSLCRKLGRRGHSCSVIRVQ
ncbi:MAG: TrbG/VirB9 family P-type conjugative transfer protein [Alphaproteobacteria bacterium]|nr:TrbG/VirB9 family P-type conjugative transfer protein [Alphaproteobacteria bacterium]